MATTHEPEVISLAELLATTRAQRGISIQKAADQIGVGYTNFRLWEKGAARPNTDHIGRVAIWLNMPLAKLLQRIGAVTNDEAKTLIDLAAREQS